jgi:small subunit ribosomal protein S18
MIDINKKVIQNAPTRLIQLRKKKVCKFCREGVEYIDYKDVKTLSAYITEKGRIPPRRVTGNCAFHQRRLTKAIKRARIVGLLPFVAS